MNEGAPYSVAEGFVMFRVETGREEMMVTVLLFAAVRGSVTASVVAFAVRK